MSDAKLVSIDPSIETTTPADLDRDQREHIGTFNAFVHILMWFVFHLPLLLGGLYVMTLGGLPVLGALMAAAGLAVLFYGITSTASQSA